MCNQNVRNHRLLPLIFIKLFENLSSFPALSNGCGLPSTLTAGEIASSFRIDDACRFNQILQLRPQSQVPE